eukprot:CAMPEP_0202444988 /NCGR_PEP_ID=MMETSP1360-20130828/3883_1 /ASSEMBLY_ACC=CAM_ASM_000848 /TAXON_ID=515479 /ORGANISM="Licmophora paradoxa, Strain CCMP2313" /LENGTH=370 /DNA_ID=CAMNT_0049061103 /DNA_START=703 /DNA_END=1815 /DNA_ORIENTATION=-
MYIAEIAPAHLRGELVSWTEIAANTGIALGFASGWVFYSVDDSIQWRLEYGVGMVLPCLMIYLSTCVLAESPRWLVAKGDHQGAENVLKEIYGEDANVEPILREIEDAMEREAHAGSMVGWSTILNPPPSFRRMLIVGVSIAIAQQAVGIEGIQYFLLYILEEGGITDTLTELKVITILGFGKLIFIVIGGKLFDRQGRRPLFFLSLLGMALSLLVLGINFLSIDNGDVSIGCLSFYLAFYCVGMGPGSWLVPAEIFASSIRVKAMSLATFFNRLIAALFSSTFLTVADAMSWGGYMIMLSFVCFIVFGYIYLNMPETKGRTLEEISIYFAEITGDRTILEIEEQLKKAPREKQPTSKTSRRTAAKGVVT